MNNYSIEATIKNNAIPISFHGDWTVYAINLAGMTMLTYMGVGTFLWLAKEIYKNRKWDKAKHPVTLLRASFMCAAISLTMRSGAAAANLWSWDKGSAGVGAAVFKATRYTDPISFIFALTWMVLLVLAYPNFEAQSRRDPLPVKWRAEAKSLIKPIKVAIMAVVMSVGVVWLRT